MARDLYKEISAVREHTSQVVYSEATFKKVNETTIIPSTVAILDTLRAGNAHHLVIDTQTDNFEIKFSPLRDRISEIRASNTVQRANQEIPPSRPKCCAECLYNVSVLPFYDLALKMSKDTANDPSTRGIIDFADGISDARMAMIRAESVFSIGAKQDAINVLTESGITLTDELVDLRSKRFQLFADALKKDPTGKGVIQQQLEFAAAEVTGLPTEGAVYIPKSNFWQEMFHLVGVQFSLQAYTEILKSYESQTFKPN